MDLSKLKLADIIKRTEAPSKEPEDRTVVRIKTSYWQSKRGLHTRRDIIFLRRQCVGYSPMEEEAGYTDAESAFDRINNLDEVGDGVYEVITRSTDYDYMTGTYDDIEMILVPLPALEVKGTNR